jgi:hypothetical protein
MPCLHSIQFRGREVDAELTNADAYEWHFFGLTPADHDALNITPDEEFSILSQLHEAHMDDVMNSYDEEAR